jgi:hypothetical protein
LGPFLDTRLSDIVREERERMGFLDKLLGRGKKTAGEAEEMGERAVDRGRDMLDRDKEPEASSAATPPAAPSPPMGGSEGGSAESSSGGGGGAA